MREDIEAIAALCMWIASIIAITLLFVGIAQYIAGVAYRLGLQSGAAQWTIYAMGLLLCIGVTLTFLGRIVNGHWWWWR